MHKKSEQLEQTIQEVCVEYNYQVTTEQWASFCDQVEVHFNNQRSKAPSKLREVISNYYHDGAKVEILMDATHPRHEELWTEVNQQIIQYLYHLKYYPADDVHLDDYSPDLRAFAQLKKNLPEFYFGCRLSTFIYSVTEFAGKEWRRSMAALKRGGNGITNQAERTAQDEATPRRQMWKHQYLSATTLQNGCALEEHIIDPTQATEETVEDHVLIKEVSVAVQTLQSDRDYHLISKLWYTLLFDDSKISELARQHNVSRDKMNKIRKRLIKHIEPMMRDWLQR